MHLAQLNIAKAKAPLDSPLLQDFVDNLDRINGIAEQSAGFIWRLQDAQHLFVIKIEECLDDEFFTLKMVVKIARTNIKLIRYVYRAHIGFAMMIK